MRPFAASTSQAAATNRLVESQLTRATGATRTAATRWSSSLNSSGSRPAVSVHQPAGTPGSESGTVPAHVRERLPGRPLPSRAASGNRSTRVAHQDDRDPPSIGGPGLGPGLELPDAGVGRRRPCRGGRRAVAPTGSAGERALAWRSVRRTISPGRGSDCEHFSGQRDGGTQLEAPRRHGEVAQQLTQGRAGRHAGELRRQQSARAHHPAWLAQAPGAPPRPAAPAAATRPPWCRCSASCR